ncbi:MAG TPA: hypothetical protein VKU89_05720 [Solirubrobacteraceae bacterium]|nr:hypothetical protein [Solirubrobacteraceae bacterium]
MKPYDQNIVTFDVMFTGYMQAATRFHDAAVGRVAAAAFIPLFEALNWAATLDWRIGAHWTPDGGKPLGGDWPERMGNADLVYGVRFVRNSVHHHWSDALGLADGRRYPRRYPSVYFEWVWRPVSELPPEKRRQNNERGEAVYRAQMEGHAALHTLEELSIIFKTIRGWLEPWLLRRQPDAPVVTRE